MPPRLRILALSIVPLLAACPGDTGTSATVTAGSSGGETEPTGGTTSSSSSGASGSTTADPGTTVVPTTDDVTTDETTGGTTGGTTGTTDATTGDMTEGTSGGTTGGVVEGELGCAPADLFDLAPYTSDNCFCGDACDCYRDVPYGEGATWSEPTLDGQMLTQAVDIYVPKGGGVDKPAVLWAHANGSSKAVSAGGGVGKNVLLPSIAAGRVVVSVEFRHPVTNYDSGAPKTDLVDAVQFVRCQAPGLGVDPGRIAGIASSRGTLMLWTAVQPELADPASADPVERQSSRLLGVYAAQAQTSYWGQWIADTFYSPELHPLLLQQLPANDVALGHAVGDVTADAPPVALAYVDPLADLPITAQTIGMVDSVHLPNFGDELCKAYAAAGHPQDCTVAYEVPQAQIHAGALPFFAALFGD